MQLFHGSRFNHRVLSPAIKHTGTKVEWDDTESNEWLYATSEENDAVLFGLFSYIEQTSPIEGLHLDGKEVTLDGEPVNLDGIVIFVYTLDKTDDWTLVNNDVNGYAEEYKTKSDVRPLHVKRVNALKFLKSNGYTVKYSG